MYEEFSPEEFVLDEEEIETPGAGEEEGEDDEEVPEETTEEEL
jgi:hypothetical protein